MRILSSKKKFFRIRLSVHQSKYCANRKEKMIGYQNTKSVKSKLNVFNICKNW
jgi:hypothetical protein